MSQSIQAAQEESYGGSDNASGSASLNAETAAALSLLDSRAVWALGLLLAFVLGRVTQKQKLPAGFKRLPKLAGLPYIGRPWGVPMSGADAAWYFSQLHKKYGPIYESEVTGTTHIWIENDKIARELLVHRGRKYGDGYELPAGAGVLGGSEVLPLMGMGQEFWRHKDALNRIANVEDVSFGYSELENKDTLRRVLDSPKEWSQHITTHCARTAARVAWGDARHGTKLMEIVQDLSKAGSPGSPPRQEADLRQQMKVAFFEARDDVIARTQAGTAEGSWMKLCLEKAGGLEKGNLSKQEAALTVGTNALIAIAATGSPLHAFFTAMCSYSSWQPRLHEELDRVCGDRLPRTADLPHLPVLRAVVKETLRWKQPMPLGLSRRTTEDDVYDGYYIPKGAVVHANAYLISRESSKYPEAEEWRPERWLEPSWPTYQEPLSEYPTIRGDAAFGYSTHACPGIELAAIELYTTIGAIAWGYNFKRQEGRQGCENAVPWYETNPYVMNVSSQFPCTVTPRSAEKARYMAGGCEDPSLLVKA
ncbi:hypothetical protein LTR36_006519 [Oleoguttula mirabilis]|uniref:Cytochrome P450 n=1 Tax=Oleoguttula mirabilis TaxID=1507867 RepID=A0AAV9JUX0_9PEZI|nr:hypothetical protein LTR36_006519 [Oleoguttula mirabilis]